MLPVYQPPLLQNDPNKLATLPTFFVAKSVMEKQKNVLSTCTQHHASQQTNTAAEVPALTQSVQDAPEPGWLSGHKHIAPGCEAS